MRPWAWLAAAAAATALGFRPGPWGWLCWFSVAPYLRVMRESVSPRQALLRGWAFGTLVWALATPWFARVCADFLALPFAAGAAVFALICAAHGSMFAVLGWALRRLAPPLEKRLGWRAFPALAACGLTALDGVYPYIFPVRWADSQYGLLPMVQSSGLLGLGFVGLLVAFSNAALEAAGRGAGRAPAAAAALLIAANLAYGRARIARVDAEAPERTLRVVLLQSGVSSRAKRDPARVEANIAAVRRLIGEALREGPADLVVWPETGYTRSVDRFYGPLSVGLKPFERAFAADAPYRVPMLVGAVVREAGHHGRPTRYYNEAILTDRDGRPAGGAVKRHLMPFGEYIPLERFFPFLRRLSPRSGGFSRGPGPRPIAGPGGSRLGVLVCYEDVITEYVRGHLAKGADLLVNMTSTDMLGERASEQHLRWSALRAAQARRWLVRAVSSGVSAAVDPAGRVRARLPYGAVGSLRAEVGLSEDRAPWVLAGEAVCRLAALAFAVLAALALKRGKRRRG